MAALCSCITVTNYLTRSGMFPSYKQQLSFCNIRRRTSSFPTLGAPSRSEVAVVPVRMMCFKPDPVRMMCFKPVPVRMMCFQRQRGQPGALRSRGRTRSQPRSRRCWRAQQKGRNSATAPASNSSAEKHGLIMPCCPPRARSQPCGAGVPG